MQSGAAVVEVAISPWSLTVLISGIALGAFSSILKAIEGSSEFTESPGAKVLWSRAAAIVATLSAMVTSYAALISAVGAGGLPGAAATGIFVGIWVIVIGVLLFFVSYAKLHKKPSEKRERLRRQSSRH